MDEDQETRGGVTEKGKKEREVGQEGCTSGLGEGQERPTCPRSYHSFPNKSERVKGERDTRGEGGGPVGGNE